jgi:hypothetical protein
MQVLFILSHFLWLGERSGLGQQAQPGQISVGRNVQVSKTRAEMTHNEVLLSADPLNPDRLVGCTMAFSPKQNKVVTLVYVSSDGGRNWDVTLTSDRGIHSGDPACTFGADGSAYFTAIERLESGSQRLLVYRSKDGGKTWSPPAILIGSGIVVDRPYVMVDQSASSYQGRVYVYSLITHRTLDGENAGLSIALWRSRDGGLTYEGPILRAPNNKQLTFHPANGVVVSDGTLLCLIAEVDSQKRNDGYVGSQYRNADIQNGTLKVIVSKDGGASIEPAFKIGEIYDDWRPEATSIPSLAVDGGSLQFKDRVYAAWADGRYGRTQILVSHSSDKGKTWSKPRIVNDDQPTIGDGPDNFMPVVAVNRAGVVAVMWYDRRDNPDSFGYSVRLSGSLDGGETWQPSIRVSEVPKTLDTESWPITGRVFRSGGSLTLDLRRYEWIAGGHTAGMAADANGIFHPFWIDNRTGVSQIWTAPVVVKGVVNRNGSSELAELEDISASVSVELTNCAYESSSKMVSCNALLKNIANEALQGPLKLRVIGLKSELGRPRVVNADNGGSGAGAVWDFAEKVNGKSLEPNQTSESKQLRFQILSPRPFRQGDYFKFTLIELEARVLGHLKKEIPSTSAVAP